LANSSDSQTTHEAKCIALGDAWEDLRRLRTAIQEYFVDTSEEFRDAATMTAAELAENVLKHGKDSSGMVTLANRAGEVVISTQNRVHSADQAKAVANYIASIPQRGARQMYIARLLEVMEEPDSFRSGLGLARIAYEGGFELSCEAFGDRLHIYAKRRLDSPLPD
jgi:hypothetical protein